MRYLALALGLAALAGCASTQGRPMMAGAITDAVGSAAVTSAEVDPVLASPMPLPEDRMPMSELAHAPASQDDAEPSMPESRR